jgi:hypothetical protein
MRYGGQESSARDAEGLRRSDADGGFEIASRLDMVCFAVYFEL